MRTRPARRELGSAPTPNPTHLVLASIAPDHPAHLHWLGEAGTFRLQIRYRITAALMG